VTLIDLYCFDAHIDFPFVKGQAQIEGWPIIET